MFGGCPGGCAQAAPIAVAAPAPVAFAPAPCGAPGPAPCGAPAPCAENRSFQYNLPPRVQCNADCSNRYSQQLVDNNNHIFVTQPVINERNHHVNYLNRTLIRDNNFHHYRVNNLYRDNVINRHYNQVFRTTRNFCDYSCTQGVIQGTCTSTPPVNTFHTLPSCGPCGAPSPCGGPAPIAAAPIAVAGPAPCGSCNGGW